VGLSEGEVASRAGLTDDQVKRFTELGIIRRREADGSYSEPDVLRARLALALEGSGISPQDLGRGIAEGVVSLDFADYAMQAPIGLVPQSYDELARELGIERSTLERIRSAFGASRAPTDAQAREDDAEMLRMASFGATLGLGDDIMLRLLRVASENLRRVVDFELELFQTAIEQPLLQEGMTERQMLDQMAALRGTLEPYSSRLVHLLHRRHEEHALFQDVIEHVEQALADAGIAERRASQPPAVAYLEVSGYTRASQPGDERGAGYPVRLGDLVQEALAFGGRPVSMLGDVVLLHFTDPCEGVRCALALIERIAQAGLPTARVGMHAGPVVVRDGEFFGRTVNTARRICDYARPGEVLVTAEVRATCPLGADLSFEEIGTITLRGLSDPVDLHLATAAVFDLPEADPAPAG
jgi:adenylate cyclase